MGKHTATRRLMEVSTMASVREDIVGDRRFLL